jgi:prevent-host-death family protein
MQTISVREANQHFSRYMSAVDMGEELVITKRGREIARIVPGKDASGAAHAHSQPLVQERWETIWKAFEGSDIHGPFQRDELYD